MRFSTVTDDVILRAKYQNHVWKNGSILSLNVTVVKNLAAKLQF